MADYRDLIAKHGIDWVLNDAVLSLLRALRLHGPGWKGTVEFRCAEDVLAQWREGKNLPSKDSSEP